MQLANIIKICHKIHKLKLIVSVSQHLSIQHPSIQPPSIQHPSIQRPSIQCPSIQCPSIQGPPSNTLLLAPSVKRSTSSVLPPSAFTLHPAPTFSSRLPPGAFSLSKCSHRPIFRDRRRVFPAKVLPPSRILGQKAHFPVQVLPPSHILGQKARFPRQSAPTVPDFGTEGAFSGQKAQFGDRGRSWGLYMCNFGGCRRI